ncbi:MAG: glycosyltransferase family 1 protein [Candidatus Manganitrophaceae bacterium]|nr:MAG: glycosyltransferase family 1 protein [Candidatus Manganitrophaceae bacterium]
MNAKNRPSLGEKKKIVTVIRHPTGGERTYLKYTYKRLDRNKYHFIVLTIRAEEIGQLKQDLKELSSEFVEMEKFNLSFFYRLFRMLFKREAHLIHSQGYACGVLSSFLNLFFRVPHVITFHGTFDSQAFRGRFAFIRKKIIQFLLSRADYINVVSEDAKANLIEYFPGMRRHLPKIVVIENGIDVGFFREELKGQKKLSEIKGIDEDSFVIGYLGRYMPEKGFPVLIDAIERLAKTPAPIKNLKVLALGWGSFIREYQALIKEKGLADHFVFIEFQPDVRWILRQIDVLVIPSLREAFGLVALEGLVSGTPIIASDCVGLREVLRGTPARMVKAGDPKDLANAILDMRANPERERFIRFIPEVVKRFDVGVTAEKLDVLFQRAGQKQGETAG